MKKLTLATILALACGGSSPPVTIDYTNCQGVTLFQSWTLDSFTPAESGAFAISPLNLAAATFGQAYYFDVVLSTGSGCDYELVVTDGGTEGCIESGSIALSNGSPIGSALECPSFSATYSIDEASQVLTIVDPYGAAAYSPTGG